jgi:mRNA interferase MazF
MIKYSVVLVPFPFDDLTSIKVRPVVCLTSEIGKYKHIVVAFISSKIPEELLDTDIVISIQSSNNQVTGLMVDSVIRLHKIVTIPKQIMKRKLGVLNLELKNEIRNKLKVLFNI